MPLKRTAIARPVETLEGRLLLSAAMSALGDGLTASEVSHLHAAGICLASSAAKSAASNPLSLLSSDLALLYSQDSAGSSVTADQLGPIESLNGDPAVSVHTHGSTIQLVHRLQRLGLTELDVLPKLHVVDGYLPLSALPLAAALPRVFAINSIDKPTVHNVGIADNQADQAMNVQLARSAFGLTGAGVKIGVISDSVNQVSPGLAGSVATGDLPKGVTVLHDSSNGGTDEGRAMLEEIHDLAPGAALYFYDDGGDQASMAAAITALKNAGCKVIVDDVGYYDEPFFQDGIISQAINSFVASGGSYFSAAGNDSNNGYLRTHLQYTTDSSSKTWVNFAPQGSTDKSLEFTIDGASTIKFQWDNPYNGVTGSATSDLNLFIYSFNGTKLVASSTSNSLTSGIPEQTVHLAPGTYQMRVQVAGLAKGAVAPDMIKFVVSPDYSGELAYVNYPGTMSSTFGHEAGPNTISVGAVAFSNAEPFSNQTPVASEHYSSVGPSIYAFDPNGQRLASPLTLDKPDVSGIDGVNTSFFGYVSATDPTDLPQFFGTSAAAPNVAAVAALIDQMKPGTSEATILAALKSSALPLNGAVAGAWNPQGGYGLVDAVKALGYFGNGPVAPTAQFAAITSPRTTAISSETITFNEPVTGFVWTDLELTLNGGPNLLTSAQTFSSSNQTTFTLGNLGALTAAAGTYTLVLTAFNSGITGDGLPLAHDVTVSWQKSTLGAAPTVKLAAVSTPRTAPISSEAIVFSESISGFAMADLTLTRNGGPNLLTSAQTLSTSDHTHYVLNSLTGLTTLAGNYALTLKTTGISANGVALAAGATISWRKNATVAGRYLFYNESVFNKYLYAPGPADDGAIATDKTALLPGQIATFANYSSYDHGLNGIMIDVAGLPASKLTAADFTFKTGNSSATSTWALAPIPSVIAVRPGAGIGGSTRITLVWTDHVSSTVGAVAGAWLAVTVKADANTGLAASDIFYFGSAIGDTGNSKSDAAVTLADLAAIAAHESTAAVPITSNWDITRNGIVNSNDVTQASAKQTSGAAALQLITPH